jgi:hypothetical protein
MQRNAPVAHRLREVDELLKRQGVTDLYGWWNGPQFALDGRTPAEAWIVGEYAAVAALVDSTQWGPDLRLREAVSVMPSSPS